MGTSLGKGPKKSDERRTRRKKRLTEQGEHRLIRRTPRKHIYKYYPPTVNYNHPRWNSIKYKKTKDQSKNDMEIKPELLKNDEPAPESVEEIESLNDEKIKIESVKDGESQRDSLKDGESKRNKSIKVKEGETKRKRESEKSKQASSVKDEESKRLSALNEWHFKRSSLAEEEFKRQSDDSRKSQNQLIKNMDRKPQRQSMFNDWAYRGASSDKPQPESLEDENHQRHSEEDEKPLHKSKDVDGKVQGIESIDSIGSTSSLVKRIGSSSFSSSPADSLILSRSSKSTISSEESIQKYPLKMTKPINFISNAIKKSEHNIQENKETYWPKLDNKRKVNQKFTTKWKISEWLEERCIGAKENTKIMKGRLRKRYKKIKKTKGYKNCMGVFINVERDTGDTDSNRDSDDELEKAEESNALHLNEDDLWNIPYQSDWAGHGYNYVGMEEDSIKGYFAERIGRKKAKIYTTKSHYRMNTYELFEMRNHGEIPIYKKEGIYELVHDRKAFSNEIMDWVPIFQLPYRPQKKKKRKCSDCCQRAKYWFLRYASGLTCNVPPIEIIHRRSEDVVIYDTKEVDLLPPPPIYDPKKNFAHPSTSTSKTTVISKYYSSNITLNREDTFNRDYWPFIYDLEGGDEDQLDGFLPPTGRTLKLFKRKLFCKSPNLLWIRDMDVYQKWRLLSKLKAFVDKEPICKSKFKDAYDFLNNYFIEDGPILRPIVYYSLPYIYFTTCNYPSSWCDESMILDYSYTWQEIKDSTTSIPVLL